MIALGCQISEGVRHTLFIGELGLDGSVLEVPGVLPIVLEAKKAGVKRCIVPEANEAEGALVKGIEIIGVKHLKQITKILSGERKKEKARNQAKKQTVKIRSRIFLKCRVRQPSSVQRRLQWQADIIFF